MLSFKRFHVTAVLLIALAHSAVSFAATPIETTWYKYRSTLVALSSNGQPMCAASSSRPNSPPSCQQFGAGLSLTELQLYANISAVFGTVLVCNSATYQAAYGSVSKDPSHWCNSFKSDLNTLSPVTQTQIPATWYVYRSTLVSLAPNGEPMCIQPPKSGNINLGGCLPVNSVNPSQLSQMVATGVFAGNFLICNSTSYQASWGPVPNDPGHWCNAFKSDVLTLNPL
jgi:hypothetical protein